jgi:hypothetical protein
MAAESAVSILDSETDFHDDLIVRDLVVDDMTARLDHLEPVQVLDGFSCLGNGVIDCIVSACCRCANEFDDLVGVAGHDVLQSIDESAVDTMLGQSAMRSILWSLRFNGIVTFTMPCVNILAKAGGKKQTCQASGQLPYRAILKT